MRTLSQRDKRALMLGGAVILFYLVAVAGRQLWRALDKRHAEYAQLVEQARKLTQDIQIYQAKADTAQRLMDTFKLDPAKLKHATAMAEASAAIQKAAMSGGVGITSLRESPARPSNKELGTLQLEAMGMVPAVTTLLGRLEMVGYPLVIDTVQFTPMPMPPGQVKVSLTIVVLDFDQWEAPHA